MTKRERAAKAAKWRRIARAFERNGSPRERVMPADDGLCQAVDDLFQVFPEADEYGDANDRALWMFQEASVYFWPLDREGDDCRVIAAGLIAAMYKTGEFG